MTDPTSSNAPDRQRRALEIVDEALELTGAARDAHLVAACGGDDALLSTVRQLLAATERAGQNEAFLAAPASRYADDIVREVVESDSAETARGAARVAQQLSGRYAVDREIGSGGNAVVYLGRDLRHDRAVAIKVVRHDLTGESQRARFAREVHIIAQLRHPYVVPLIDSGDADGTLYYVMPFIEGPSLRQRLDGEGALSIDETLAIGRDVAEALDAAHAQGIVHRDIKPQNVLLSGQHALVADFGIALAVDGKGGRVTERGVSVGTPAYMSPEQAGGEAVIDGRSDIYSLGCVVYEMLTGEVPYPGDTPRSVGAKHLHAPVPDLTILRPALPGAVKSVMERALAKLPADRYSSAGSFITDLARALSAPRERPLAIPTYRKPWVVAVAAAALIAVVYGASRIGGFWSTGAGDGRIGLGVMPLRPLDGKSEWSEALPDLLATYLDGTPGVRVADPWALWRPLRASANAPAHSPDPAEAELLAKHAGVSRYVLGTVMQTGSRLDLTMRLYSVSARDPVATTRVSGSSDSVPQLAQRAAIAILKDVWTGATGPNVPRLESVVTQSPEALKAYLAAREAMRRGLTDSADAAITRAITIDSTFALGVLDAILIRTWVQSVRFTSFSGLRELTERAVAHRDSLTERQRLRLQATMASIETDGPGAARAWQALLQRDSTDLAAAEGLAYASMAYGWQFGAQLPDVIRATERVIRIDSTYVPALFRLAHLLPATLDAKRVREHLQRMQALNVATPLARAAIAANAALLADDRVFINRLDTLATLPQIEWITTYRRLRSYRPDRALTLLQRTREINHEMPELAMRSAALGMDFATGRLRTVDSLWVSGALDGVQRPLARRVVLAALQGTEDTALTQRALTSLAGLAKLPRADAPPTGVAEWDIAWPLGAWNAARGDTNTARRWISVIRQLSPDGASNDWRSAFAADIEGRIADRRGDSRAAVADIVRAYTLMRQHVDNAQDESPEPTLRWRYAQALVHANMADSAATLLRSFTAPTSWIGAFVARAQFTLGQLAEAKGNNASAARAYDSALQLWSFGDSTVDAVRTAARAGLQRTAGGKRLFHYGDGTSP